MKITFTTKLPYPTAENLERVYIFARVAKDYSNYGHIMQFGMLKNLAHSLVREQGDLHKKGVDYKGFRVSVFFDFRYSPLVALNVTTSYYHRIIPLLPRVKFRLD